MRSLEKRVCMKKKLQHYLSTKDPILFGVSGRHIGGYTFDPLHAYTYTLNIN